MPCMHWIQEHHLLIGIAADGLTFLGGGLLTRDAFLRLRDLKGGRTDREFHRQNPDLRLTDQELKDAKRAMRWTLAGFSLITLGFACQLLLRLAGD